MKTFPRSFFRFCTAILISLFQLSADGKPTVAISKVLENVLEVHFPGRLGNVSVRDMNGFTPISSGESPMTMDSDCPVHLILGSGTFPVEANAFYAVNFSDRPPVYLRADAAGKILIPISRETNYTALTISLRDECRNGKGGRLRNIIQGSSGEDGRESFFHIRENVMKKLFFGRKRDPLVPGKNGKLNLSTGRRWP